MSRRGGFTLIEVLLAALVLAAGLTAVVIAMGRAVEGSRHAEYVYRASYILQEKVEQLVMDASLGDGIPAGGASGTEQTPSGPVGWTIVNEGGKGPVNPIDVFVFWTERSRPQRLSVQLDLKTRSET